MDVVVGGVAGKAQVQEAVKVHVPQVQAVEGAVGAEAERGVAGLRRRDLGAVSASKVRGAGRGNSGVMVWSGMSPSSTRIWL